jgi:hypothetical protein
MKSGEGIEQEKGVLYRVTHQEGNLIRRIEIAKDEEYK